MKKILLIGLFLISFFGNAQESYRIEITNFHFDEWTANSQCGPNKHIWLKIHYETGNPETIYEQWGDIHDDNTWTFNVVKNRKPISIESDAFIHEKSWGLCEGNTAGWDNVYKSLSSCYENTFIYSHHQGDAHLDLRYDIKITPIINILAPTTGTYPENITVGQDELFNVNATTGFDSSLYHWQYARLTEMQGVTPTTKDVVGTAAVVQEIGDCEICDYDYGGGESCHTNHNVTESQCNEDAYDSDWSNWNQTGTRTIPAYTTTTWHDVLPNQYSSNFNNLTPQQLVPGYLGYIVFRIKSCNDSDTSIHYQGDPPEDYVIYNIVRSPPGFDTSNGNAVTPINETCSGDGQTGFIAHFSRSLDSNESLHWQIKDYDNPNINYTAGYIYALDSQNTVTVMTILGSGHYSISFTSIINQMPSTPISTDFTITNPLPLTFTTTAIDAQCFGDNGTVTITASEGTPGYEWSENIGNPPNNVWVPFGNGNNSTTIPLSVGTHTIYIRDANGCTPDPEFQTVTIGEPSSAFDFDPVELHNPTAFGFHNGYIQATLTGGWGGYTDITWDPIPSTATTQFDNNIATLSGIPIGTYTLTAKDSHGCVHSKTFKGLRQPPSLTVTASVSTPISCNVANVPNSCTTCNQDGAITVTAEGGVPPYKFQLKDSNGSLLTEYQEVTNTTSHIFTGLSAANYNVNIIDANTITVGTYTVDNNNTYTLSDTNDFSINLQEPDPITIQADITAVNCFGGETGEINFSIGSPDAPYTSYHYIFSDANGIIKDDTIIPDTSTHLASDIITDLAAGTYTLAVSTNNGCTTIQPFTFTITQPEAPLAVSYTYTEPLSATSSDGQIIATITGGTPNYTYSWTSNGVQVGTISSPNPTTGEIILDNVPAGHYLLSITDANGCTLDDDYTLQAPRPLVVDHFEVTQVISCHGDSNGALQVFGDGGVNLTANENSGLNYFFAWYKQDDTGNFNLLSNQTSNIATGLSAGTYQVVLTDHNTISSVFYQNIAAVPNDAPSVYTFTEPEPLSLTFEKQDVYCIGGDDAWAKVIVNGGTPDANGNYQIAWQSGETTALVTNLTTGTYSITVTDSSACETTATVTIEEPSNPITITYNAFATPTTGGASDGWIKAQITGGTAFADGTYNYEWTDINGTILNAQTSASTVNNIFTIQLNDIAAGMYYLTITDANYDTATNQDGCTITMDEFTMYDPIEATIAVLLPISCNQDNTFNNPYADGQLTATVTGGLPFDTGSPYIYHWFIKDTNGDYVPLANQTSETATDLMAGEYAFNVEDAQGHIIGTYNSNTLNNATNVLFTFNEPALLEASITSTPVSCNNGNDGSASLHITGGTAPYDIEWSNGDTTDTITDLIPGSYIAFITDARACETTVQVVLEQPSSLTSTIISQNNPTCYQGNDGSIAVSIAGGQTPYTSFGWVNGPQTLNWDNLSAGTYRFQVTDSSNCNAFIDVALTDPEAVPLSLGDDRTLCDGQTLDFDIAIPDTNATYLWESTTGFSSTSPQVTLSTAGTYTATVTNSLGCSSTDDIIINTSSATVDAQFLLTSQAFADEDVILINTSNPVGENTQWIIPNNVTTVSQTNETITLHFPEEGVYQIGLESQQGACIDNVFKPITVREARQFPNTDNTTDNLFINDFTVQPNPTAGDFLVHVTLAEPADISLRLFNLISEIPLDDRQEYGLDEYTINYSNNSFSPGVYFLLLETPHGSQIRKIIMQ